MTNNSRIVSLALAGLAAGGAIWYLLGTEQGKSMCHNLMDSAKDLSGNIKDTVNDKWSDLSDRASDLASKASDLANNATSKVNNATSNL